MIGKFEKCLLLIVLVFQSGLGYIGKLVVLKKKIVLKSVNNIAIYEMN